MKAGEKKCPQCAETVKKDAVVCRHCRYQFTAEDFHSVRAGEKKNNQQAFGCVGLIVVVLILARCVGGDEKKSEPDASPTSAAQPLSFAQAKEMEVANKAAIAAKVKQAQTLSSSDIAGNEKVYSELVTLAPTNSSFVEKRAHYRGLLAEQASYADNPERALDISKFSWEKGGFGSVQLVRFTVNNKASFAIKDFTLVCHHQGASGTDMDENTRVVYQVAPAHGSVRVREVNMGLISSQVSSSWCNITDAVAA